ncbi:MAG TPA: hypothetical protein DIW80_19440 [Gordonia polyisoprenivorans]|uniref:hypothetical protein n=1 Tax=uncultured Gordonia sp. TaxID=198437 RepID=UPI000EDA7989|nr:hypothetical protein [uncultured Gordonia sp.]HCS59058.1 hypothetical protein [Gordonia polyisoprenivorans]
MTSTVVDATLRRLDEAARAARRRAHEAYGTVLHEMMLDLADAASDRADGYRTGCEAVAQVPGPMVGQVVAALLRVTPDPEDSGPYDCAFRAALAETVRHLYAAGQL